MKKACPHNLLIHYFFFSFLHFFFFLLHFLFFIAFNLSKRFENSTYTLTNGGLRYLRSTFFSSARSRSLATSSVLR